MNDESLKGYRAALEAAAFYPQPEAGLIRIGGPDQVSFLQRQTSNDVRLLAPGKVVLTALTSPTARILDVFALLKEPEAIAALTGGGAAATARFLKSRIFFMDKVTVEEASAGFTQIDLLGPRTADILLALGAPGIPAMNEVVTVKLPGAEDQTLQALAAGGPFGLGLRLLAPAETGEGLIARLEGLGAQRLDGGAYRTLRVEAGLPEAGAELTEAYTPFEAGLKSAVSGDKGCYTGQEVLARQVTYDKITQKLCGLRLEGPVQPGWRVLVDGKAAGEVTSAAVSPRFGPLALAVLRKPNFEPGINARVVSAEGETISGSTTSLPFGSP